MEIFGYFLILSTTLGFRISATADTMRPSNFLKELIRADEDSEDFAGINPSLYKSLGVTYKEQGRYDEAERLLGEALKASRLQLGDKHPQILPFMLYLAQVHKNQEHYDEADDLLQEGLQIVRQKLRPEHRMRLNLVNAYAVLQTKRGHYDEAEKLFDEALKGKQR